MLAFFYGLIPNYAVAIALLTIVVMIVVFPLTRASARSMMRMQLLAPEMKKIQARYKAKPGMPAAERQELRQKMNEEVMALYRENGVNPTGGCLPMFLQFPILIVLYDVVKRTFEDDPRRERRWTSPSSSTAMRSLVSTPQNIPKTSLMYHDLVAAKGQMYALGINLADSVRSHQSSLVDVIPYAVLVLVAVGLQYVSIWQVTTRNPAASAAANPQMQSMQKFMPLIFLVLYIALPAGVGVYFIVSSMFRVAQQEWMYKHDPTIVAAIQELTKRKQTELAASAPAEAVGPRRGAGSGDGAAGAAAAERVSWRGCVRRPRPAAPRPAIEPSKPPHKPAHEAESRAARVRPKRGTTNGSKPRSSQNGSGNGSGSEEAQPATDPARRALRLGRLLPSRSRASRDKRPRRGQ